MEQENQLYGKEFEVLEVPCDHVKSEKEPVSVMQKENIKVENNFEGNKSEITHVFIKDEYGQCINTGLDNTVAVSDRSYKAPDKIANFDHNFIRFGVLKRHDKKIEFQKDLDNIIYKVTEDSDQLTIKKENDEQRFINEGTEIVLNRAAAEHDFTKPLIKCEALEELKLDTDLDIETCGSTENIEEYMFTNDNDHILKQPRADGIHKPNDCVHCDMTFSVKRNLDDHIIRKHPDFIAEVSSKIYACAHCTFKTTIKEGLVRHMRKRPGAESDYKPKKCVHCNVTFRIKRTLDDHIIRKHPDFIAEVSTKIHACTHCTYKSTIKENLVQHMLKHPEAEGEYKLKQCVHCNVEFRHKAALDDHIIKKHPEYIAFVSSKIHECKYCVYKTTSKYNLGRHMDKHMEAEGGCEPKSCIHCNATFKSKRNLDDHIVKNHPGFTAEISSKIHVCAHCTYKTARKDGLVRHLLIHSGAEDDTKLKKCVHCNGAFRRKTTLDDHIIKKHPGYISSVSSKVHECIYCMYKTTIKGKLAKHMLNHPDFTAYKSSIKGNLVKHMLKHPGAKGNYKFQKCVHCNGEFRHKTALDDHIIRKHPEHTMLVSRKIYECKYCVFKTTSKFNISRHMGKHSETKNGSALKKCGHCDEAFTRNIAFNNHIIKKHPEYIASISGKIHECKYCIYKTAVKSHLVGHMMGKHPRTGAEVGCERKTCIHCNAMFKDKINLDDHIIKKHPDFIVDVSSGIHECAHCAYRTIIKKSLARHMLRHRGTECEYKPKKCIYCNEAFARKVSLNNHIIAKHPEYIASISSKIHE